MKPYSKEKYVLTKIMDNSTYYEDIWYDGDFYDGEGFDDVGEYDMPNGWYCYIYIANTNRFVIMNNKIKIYSDFKLGECSVYIDKNNDMFPTTYSYTHSNKVEAFFGCVLKVLKSTQKTDKIENMFNKLCEKYPEVYLRLIAKNGK